MVTSVANSKNRYAFADSLRGIAALWVVLYHLFHGNHVQVLSNNIGSVLTAVLFEYGNLGVPIFFVLSGFVMAVTTSSKQMHASQCINFMIRRLVRLTPPYYFSILLSVLLLWVKYKTVDSSTPLPDVSAIVAHMFYLQEFFNFKEINVIYWTLCFEIQFYIAFTLLIFIAGKFKPLSFANYIVLIVFTLVGLLWLISEDVKSFYQTNIYRNTLFLPYWYAFSVGALVGWTLEKTHYLFKSYVIFFFISLMVYGLKSGDLFALTAGLTATLLLLAHMFNKMGVWLNINPLQKLGLISYSLYLIHNNVLGIVGRVIRKFIQPSLSADVMVMLVSLLVCLVCAYIMYVIIEKPFIKLSQKIKY